MARNLVPQFCPPGPHPLPDLILHNVYYSNETYKYVVKHALKKRFCACQVPSTMLATQV